MFGPDHLMVVDFFPTGRQPGLQDILVLVRSLSLRDFADYLWRDVRHVQFLAENQTLQRDERAATTMQFQLAKPQRFFRLKKIRSRKREVLKKK